MEYQFPSCTDLTQILTTYIPETEHARLRKFIHVQDSQRSVLGILLVYYALKQFGLDWREFGFVRDEAMRPRLVNGDESVEFSVSHHGDWVVVGITVLPKPSQKDVDIAIGIDVMKIECPGIGNDALPMHHDKVVDEFLGTFRDQLTDTEWAYIQSITSTSSTPSQPLSPQNFTKLQHFYHIWCLKESYLKACGVGIAGIDSLQTIAFEVVQDAPIRMVTESAPPFAPGCSKGIRNEDFVYELMYLDTLHPVALAYAVNDNGIGKVNVTVKPFKVISSIDELLSSL